MINRNEIVFGDCLEYLKSINDNTFDVTFTSPPYGDVGTETFEEIRAKGKGNNPNGTHRKYLNIECHVNDWFDWQVELINELLRVTKKYVIYNVGAIYPNRTNVYKLIGHFAENIHDDIIWYKSNGLPCHNEGSISNTYEHILIIKKNPKDKVKVNGFGFRNVINGIGVNSQNEFADIHHAVMNKKLSDLIISKFTSENDFVLDPFMGSGTTALACKMMRLNYVGSELSSNQVEWAENRIKNGKGARSEDLNKETIFDI